MAQNQEVRSQRNNNRCYLRFINKTNVPVNLVWIDFNGKYVSYRLLNQNDFVDINTFKNHPWIAIDTFTNERLHIDKTFIYLPKSSMEYLQERYPDEWRNLMNCPFRVTIFITLPLYSLRYRCLLEVSKYIKNTNDISDLDLPKRLVDDLKKVINRNFQIL